MHLERGSTHQLVERVQEALADAGFDPGPIDCQFGEQTVAALEEFQTANDLEVTGTVDEATIEALEIDAELPSLEPERAQFRSLLLENPNYFGNLSGVQYEPEVDLVTDTSYEELTCIGYSPNLERLDAVVHVKREYGYGGGICSTGTPEFVRFYVDWKNDGTWSDEGMASFTAYDIPGEKPLEYAVSTSLDPDEELCTVEQLPRVRAILSWNQPPPPGTPKYDPVWGNVLESRIQIDAADVIDLGDFLNEIDTGTGSELLDQVDLAQPLHLQSTQLSTKSLLEQYAEMGVPGKRGAFSTLQSYLNEPLLTADSPDLEEFGAGLDFDVAELVSDLEETVGNTRYEELECIGLNDDDVLTATIRIKRPNGYGGDLCTDGSQEYVAFWEEDPSGGWSYLGTTSVTVHDIDNIPKDGLEYSAVLPVDLSHRQQPCAEGASTVRIRAIGSWEQQPPQWDPDWTPTWGNREETRVHVSPGPQVGETEQVPYMHRVGNMQVCDINQGTGLATGQSKGANFTAEKSPFGGEVYVSGIITNPPNIMEGSDHLEYRVSVRPYGSGAAWQPVTDSFTIDVLEKQGPGQIPQQDTMTQEADDGFFKYQQDTSGNAWRLVDHRRLAEWDTGNRSGKWEIKLEAKLSDGTIVPAGSLSCPGGETRSTVVVRLDNDRSEPEADIEITNGTPMSDTDESCEMFAVGQTVKGTFNGKDEHFHHLRLSVNPSPPGNPSIDPPRHFQYTSYPTGTDGTWTLDTTGMRPCGYTANVVVEDRTIVNSRRVGRRSRDSAGFCVLLPEMVEAAEEAEEAETTTNALSAAVEEETDGGQTVFVHESSLAVADLHVDAEANDHENPNDEYVVFENAGDETIDLTGYRVADEAGHEYTFPDGFTLAPGEKVRLRSGSGPDSDTDLHWGSDAAVWNNEDDTVFVYDEADRLVVRVPY